MEQFAGAGTDQVAGPREERVDVGGGVSLAAYSWRPSGAPAEVRAAEPPRAPFVLLHGIASSARTWHAVAGRLAAAGHPVWALDWRGHGRSDRPEDGYDLPAYAADLAAALGQPATALLAAAQPAASLGQAAAALGVLATDRPILVGHSLGAMVILEAVSRRPELARGVALLEGGLVDAAVQFATLDECLAKVALPPVGGMPAARVEGYLRASNPNWPPDRLAAAMAAFDVQPDGTVVWRLTPPRVQSLARSMWHQHAPELWPELRVPALIVAADTGDAAWTAQKREAAAAAVRTIPYSRVEWLTGDHAIHEALPDAVAALLLEAAAGFWA
jgi:pimeloyl-ACP methyl ester carboxylesterase